MYVYHISAELQRGWAKQRAKRCAGNMLTKIAHKMRRDFGDFVRDNGYRIRERERERRRHGWRPMDGRLNKNLINFFYVFWVFVSLYGQKTEPRVRQRWQEARMKWAVTCFVRGTWHVAYVAYTRNHTHTHIQLHAQLHVKGRPETLLQSEATRASNGIVAPMWSKLNAQQSWGLNHWYKRYLIIRVLYTEIREIALCPNGRVFKDILGHQLRT